VVETRRLNELTSDALQRLLLPGGPCTIALSGGADSAALAFLALRSGVGVDAVHVHHGFAASDQLADAAVVIAGQLGIDLEMTYVEMEPGASPENMARAARYRVLDNWPGLVVTAHTRDDNAETILMNLVRGTGISGLAGIPRHRPPVTWRPMLDITRSETREIATLAGLGFVDDPMNDDADLTRVFMRQQVMPLLREINPQSDEALARAASAVRADADYLESVVPESSGAIAASIVLTMPRPIAHRMLMGMLENAGISPSSDRLRRMWSVVSGQAQSQELSQGVSVVRRGALIFVE
jgi:tRNA(Ile)-lysidine synthase